MILNQLIIIIIILILKLKKIEGNPENLLIGKLDLTLLFENTQGLGG